MQITRPRFMGVMFIESFIVSTGAWGYPPECFEEVFKLTFDYLGMKYAGMLYCQMASKSEVSKFQSKITAFINECVLTS